jgi:hypothetical protein
MSDNTSKLYELEVYSKLLKQCGKSLNRTHYSYEYTETPCEIMRERVLEILKEINDHKKT